MEPVNDNELIAEAAIAAGAVVILAGLLGYMIRMLLK